MSQNAGPQTEEGKARSALNSLKTGLFAAQDFIRDGEEVEYAELRGSFIDELQPEGAIEEALAAEVIGAAWRLRRCRLIESDFSARLVLDPMLDAFAADEQKSVDRARMQSHNLLRRSMAELRKVQTERVMRVNLKVPANETPGLTDSKQILHGLKLWDSHLLNHRKAEGLDSLEGLIAQADKNLCEAAAATRQAPESSFCKSAAAPSAGPNAPSAPAAQPPAGPKNTPRNALCPCRSGQKFKRCCGRNAPPVLHERAA
jgi:hypothetical protein